MKIINKRKEIDLCQWGRMQKVVIVSLDRIVIMFDVNAHII